MSRCTRRQALAGLAALPVAVRSGPAADPALDALARAGGRRFGSAIAWNPRNRDSGSVQNPAYAALVRRECGIVVPENEMKWQWLRKSHDAFDFRGMDGIVRWARQGGLAVRGHTLPWHRPNWFPAWLHTYAFGPNLAAAAARLL